MASNPRKVARKAAGGGIDGIIAGLVAPLVIAWVKSFLGDQMPPDIENSIAGTVGIAVSMVIIALKRGASNWWKHRKDK